MFELIEDLLKMIINNKYKVDVASLSDTKKMFDFAKDLYFDVKVTGKKSTRDRTLRKIVKSPAIMASGISAYFYHLIPTNYVIN